MRLIVLVLILFFSWTSIAQDSTPPQAAQSLDELISLGLKNYKAGKFDEATTQFQQALLLQPNNASVVYNLGLAEYRMGKIGPAMASWRKALIYDESMMDARDAIAFAKSKLEHKDLPHQVMLLETLRGSYLLGISVHQLLSIFALCLFSFGWVFIKYLGARKSAAEAEMPKPSLSWKIPVLLVLLIFAGSLTGAKIYDSILTRATILPKVVEVRAGPDAEQASLFDIYEGLEVLVDDIQNNWVKITYPGGRTGWVPQEAIAITK